MKKVILTLAAVALLAVVFSSCSKECYCTTKDLDGTVIFEDVLVPGLTTSSQCAAYETTQNMSGFQEVECDAR